MSQTGFTTYRLHFPAEVMAEAVAELLRTLASESRGGLLSPSAPVIFETWLVRGSVSWWLHGPTGRLRRLQAAAERALPGLRFEQGVRPNFEIGRALELRVDAQERLLDSERTEASVARLLGVGRELGRNERLLVQWQIGVWLPRSPIPPAGPAEAPTIWNLPDWGRPVRDAEQVQAARKKHAEHLFAAVGRVAVAGAGGSRANQLAGSVVNAYQLLRAPGVGVSRRALPSWWVRRRLDQAVVPRLGPPSRLSASELAGVIGWPVGNPELPGVRYAQSRRLRLDRRVLVSKPSLTTRMVGRAGTPAQHEAAAVLPVPDGLRHLHVLGPTGVGKSTLLAQLILSDIAAGRGVVAIDPKGDLVSEVLARLPERAAERVVVLDPSDSSPVGFNPLAGDGGVIGIDGVLHVLRSIWSASWGPRLADVLHAGLLTLARAGGHSLPELPLLLSDPGFRRPLVRRAVVSDPLGLGTFWPWFEALGDDARAQVLAPVMNKLRAFLLRPELRAVLGQAEPRFQLDSVFSPVAAQRRCLLVRLPKGTLGAEGAQLLGSLLVAQLWRQALRRSAVPVSQRVPVFWYLDEFQDVLRLELDLADALVQARSTGTGLVLAHQHAGQLTTEVRAALLANAGSRIAFRLDQDDAAIIAKRSRGDLRPEDLMGLGAFEAYASLLAGGESTGYGSLVTEGLDERWPVLRDPTELQRLSADRFGVPATETEARLRRLVEGGGEAQRPGRAPLGGQPISGNQASRSDQ